MRARASARVGSTARARAASRGRRVVARAVGGREDALGGQDFIYSQRSGVEETLFKGVVLGVDADVASGEHREGGFRSFGNVEGEFYVPERFMERVATHVAKNLLADRDGLRSAKPAVMLGIWGHKGCGKTFNVELACKRMGLMPIVTSAGELEDGTAGEPGAMLRRRYLTAARAMRETGRLSCLIINDIDAGIGRFRDDLGTVNNQITHGTLMNICDNPTLVSEGNAWRHDAKMTNARVPIIVTGNDFSRLYAPLTRDGRMDLWMWEPTRDELAKMLHAITKDDGLSEKDCETLVDTFPQQPLDFFGAIRARVYDDAVRDFILDVGLVGMNEALVGGVESKRKTLGKVNASLERLIQAGHELCEEQENVSNIQLAREYMRWQDPEDLERARSLESAARTRGPPTTYEPDETAVAMREEAKATMRAATAERARTAGPVAVEEVEEGEIEEVPWRVENIGEAQRLYESGTPCFDIRPLKDFNRETLKGATSMPAAVRTGGISDFVDTPAVDAMLAAIAADKKYEKTSTVVVFHGAEASEAYRADALRALTTVFDDVIEVEGGFPFYFKHFTPGGKRRPRYVGYGAENEETFWTASN
ncbi:P-loop containing nucleoside triphosphate hydrolase [Ostreococcus tauri]|uniref:Ribulose bisphosphate carboxylase/oxygenase activase, chloroplastic n=1 Tax=Ostreococcus tauri TaxID=70448 RepID=A0A090M4J9_OSTTA|nr:P-loop containing nucleoside triphosphate hydrolase [Ostreococcus tauri]CEF97602.1 P-loop containing nucleoside triphosphate hydrolase [Ostreococcus tauri]|eukprot:XP_022838779.1 P-loop containing nucleoside triphosphate hydrolase [Ostreococcus tauri]